MTDYLATALGVLRHSVATGCMTDAQRFFSMICSSIRDAIAGSQEREIGNRAVIF